MPDGEVQTIRDLICYQYAKVAARNASPSPEGIEAPLIDDGLVNETFRKLKRGEITWSDVAGEDGPPAESGKRCIYCGTDADIRRDHLVPGSIRIKVECASCAALRDAQNEVFACRACSLLKGTLGLYEFYRAKHPGERRFDDFIPPPAEKKYLKTIVQCHRCASTLDRGDVDGDGEITVLDIDFVLRLRR